MEVEVSAGADESQGRGVFTKAQNANDQYPEKDQVCEVFSRSLKRVMEYRLSDNKSGKPAQLG